MPESERRRSLHGESGLSLIELMVVVLVIGLLLTIAVPTFLRAQHNAKSKAATSNLRSAVSAAKTVYGDTDSYDSSAIDASVLRSAEPSLEWAGSSSGPETIGFEASSVTKLLLAVKSKNGDCFFLRDDVSGAATAGTWYGRKNGVGAGACTPEDPLTSPTNDYSRVASDGWK